VLQNVAEGGDVAPYAREIAAVKRTFPLGSARAPSNGPRASLTFPQFCGRWVPSVPRSFASIADGREPEIREDEPTTRAWQKVLKKSLISERFVLPILGFYAAFGWSADVLRTGSSTPVEEKRAFRSGRSPDPCPRRGTLWSMDHTARS
jgi:hypothetical protein